MRFAYRPVLTRVVPLGILVALSGALCVGCKDSRQSATSPSAGQVVLYCSADQTYAEPIVAAFEQQSGIKVLARYDTEASKTVGLVQKIRAEGQTPVADVFWSNEIFYTIRLAQEGLLAPYTPSHLHDWPETFKDPQGLWHGFALRSRVIGYNTQRVDPEQAPRCLEDVLDAKWKGRVVMASPNFGTTGGDVASWFVHYGPDRACEILNALKANNIRIVDGNSTALRLVATGQADICFTDTDDVYAGQRNGWPVAMNVLDQASDGALTIPNTVALIANAPHPEQARRLVDFLLSPQVETMLARSDSHNTPLHPGVRQEFPQYAFANPLAVDYQQVAQALPQARQLAEEILP